MLKHNLFIPVTNQTKPDNKKYINKILLDQKLRDI